LKQKCEIAFSQPSPLSTIIKSNLGAYFSKEKVLTRWASGAPITVKMRWALGSSYRPTTDPEQPFLSVDPQSATYTFKGCWSLLRMLDLQRSKEYIKAIRRGDVPEQELRSFFDEKIKYLEKLYETSTLQYSPDEGAIKTLLVNCLEMHYGSLNNVLKIPNREAKALEEIKKVMENYGI
jgi:hypothetical protein